MDKFTPGPWRQGRAGSVVSDTPVPEMGGSDHTDYYGGHLICESITLSNARLVWAAPELLAACRAALELMESGSIFVGTKKDPAIVALCRAAITKATRE